MVDNHRVMPGFDPGMLTLAEAARPNDRHTPGLTGRSRRGWRWRRRLAAALAAAALAAVMPAAAKAGSLYIDAGLGVGGGSAMSLNLQSFQEQKYHDTIAQEHDFSCGSAALATLLSYNYHMPVSESAVFNDMIVNGDKTVISESGFSLLDIKRYLARHGLDSNGYRAPIEKLEEVRLPAIVLLNVRGYRHFVVLEGIEHKRVLLADPAVGMRSEPLGVFEEEWSGIFFLITSDIEQGQKSFNSDQKWAAAPPPPWSLTRYALDLSTLSQQTLLAVGRF
jgi:predicted double-glycine peptidase